MNRVFFILTATMEIILVVLIIVLTKTSLEQRLEIRSLKTSISQIETKINHPANSGPQQLCTYGDDD